MMTWNFDFALLTALIFAVILGFYFGFPRLRVKLNTYFLLLIITEAAALLLDTSSSFFDMHPEDYSIGFLYFINTIYFVSFYTRSAAFFSYILCLTGRTGKNSLAAKRILFGIYTLAVALQATDVLTGAVFRVTAKGGYQYGPFYFTTYIFLFFFGLAGLVFTALYRSVLSKRDLTMAVIAQIFPLAGGLLRLIYPTVFLLGTTYMLATLVLYLGFENTDRYMDERTDTFNSQALDRVLRERARYEKPYWFCTVSFRNYSEFRRVYGGVMTDRLLGDIGTFLRKSFRRCDLYYIHFGTFVLVGSDGSRAEEMDRIIRERAAQPWILGDTRIHTDILFGTLGDGIGPDRSNDLLEFLRRFFDKESRGEQTGLPDEGERKIFTSFVIDHELLDKTVRELAVNRALSRAIQGDGVGIFLQPIIDAESGKMVAAEALARISDPQLGLIMPGEFIPLAEANGSIGALGEQVFRKAVAFLSSHRDIGLSFININLSPIQCMDRNLAARFEEIMKHFDVGPEKIHLEITEESMVDAVVLERQMDIFITKGFSFALDDYGSGYANEFRLKHYPFAGVKLDMSIVWSHFRQPDGLLPGVVKLLRERDLSVTAEGVETEEMAAGLVSMGCNYLQGYYYSKPLSIEDFLAYVQTQSN